MNEKKLLGFKNKNNYLRHLVDLFNIQCSQFVYNGLPDTLPSEFIEFYLAINGTVAIGKVSKVDKAASLPTDSLFAAVGSYNGNYNGYLPMEYTAAVLGVGEITGKWFGADKSIVVGKNNLQGAPEFDIPFTADVLSQIDISESVNIIFSRLSRIPIVDNDVQKTAIESAIKSIVKGDIYAVANRNVKSKFEEFLETAKDMEKDRFVDLVDVDKINCLQYLNQYHDNVFKRFLSKRGYMIQTTSKLAQQTNSEIHGSDSYSLLYPLQQLEQRKTMCENINSLFGLSVSVDFNPILKKVYADYMSDKPEEETGQQTDKTEETEETKPEEVEDNDSQSSND